jgi:site-specific recombinase XerD
VMRAAGDGLDGVRLRGVIVVLWRAGLRISEALALNETDLDRDRGALLICHGKGDKRREVGMARWAWSHLEPWLELRTTLPVRRLFSVLRRPTRGRACAPAAIRVQLHHAAVAAGVRRRFAPHQLRHAHAVEMSREGISLIVIQRQLGHYAGDPVKRVVVVGCRELGHDAWASRRSSRPLKIFRRPIWPLSAASSRWRWIVGRNSCVVWK